MGFRSVGESPAKQAPSEVAVAVLSTLKPQYLYVYLLLFLFVVYSFSVFFFQLFFVAQVFKDECIYTFEPWPQKVSGQAVRPSCFLSFVSKSTEAQLETRARGIRLGCPNISIVGPK